jgi:hypothetical protein
MDVNGVIKANGAAAITSAPPAAAEINGWKVVFGAATTPSASPATPWP